MRMVFLLTLVMFSTWPVLLAYGVNIVISFMLSASAIILAASIKTKIDFGTHFNKGIR